MSELMQVFSIRTVGARSEELLKVSTHGRLRRLRFGVDG
jgi:hypothetical protein